MLTFMTNRKEGKNREGGRAYRREREKEEKEEDGSDGRRKK